MKDSLCVTHERRCPVCESNSYVQFASESIDQGRIDDFTYASRKTPEFMRLRLVRCLCCDLVYAPSPPDVNFLSTSYSDAAYNSGQEAQAAADSYAKALAPHLTHLKDLGAAIDVGAGNGALLPLLRKSGFTSVLGIEPSHAAIEEAPPDIRPLLREGMFSPSLIADVTPSLICAFMTLEHMDSPRDFVKSAFDVLRPGGMLALVVHNWRAPVNRLLGLRSPIMDIEHLQLFSQSSLRILLERCNFSCIDFKKLKNIYPIQYWLRITPLNYNTKMRIINVFDKIGISNKLVSLPTGNIFATAKKCAR